MRARRDRAHPGRGRTTPAAPPAPALVGAEGGTATVDVAAIPTTLNPHSAAGNTAATLLVSSAVWPQVFAVAPKVAPKLNTDLVQSAEVVSVDPQTVVYQIDPRGVVRRGAHLGRRLRLRLGHATRGSGGRRRHAGIGGLECRVPRHRQCQRLQRRQDGHRRVPHAVRRLAVAVRRPAPRARRPAGGVEPRVRPLRPGDLRVGRPVGTVVVDAGSRNGAREEPALVGPGHAPRPGRRPARGRPGGGRGRPGRGPGPGRRRPPATTPRSWRRSRPRRNRPARRRSGRPSCNWSSTCTMPR